MQHVWKGSILPSPKFFCRWTHGVIDDLYDACYKAGQVNIAAVIWLVSVPSLNGLHCSSGPFRKCNLTTHFLKPTGMESTDWIWDRNQWTLQWTFGLQIIRTFLEYLKNYTLPERDTAYGEGGTNKNGRRHGLQ